MLGAIEDVNGSEAAFAVTVLAGLGDLDVDDLNAEPPRPQLVYDGASPARLQINPQDPMAAQPPSGRRRERKSARQTMCARPGLTIRLAWLALSECVLGSPCKACLPS